MFFCMLTFDFFNKIILVYRDTCTPQPFIENFPNKNDPTSTSAALPNHVYLDAMGFGMGCSCLQITFQVCFLCFKTVLLVII